MGSYGYDGSMIWANVEVTNNEANAENVSNGSYAIGVGVSLSSVELWGSEVEITRNVSSRGSVGPIYMTGQGAGLAADAGSLVLSDANVSENQFTFSSVNDSAFGGGAYLSDVEADFTRVIFGGNDIGGGTAAGAAMYAYGTFILDFANLLVLDNDASSITSGYGSLALAGAGTASITNADFYQNTVSGGVGAYGGAAYVGPGTTLNLDSTTLMSNSCAGTATPACGGAIYLDGTSSIGSDAYTNYYGNSPGDIGGIVSMNGRTGNFVGNPLYTSGGGTDYSAWDLSVATGSPCINAGNPSILDVDGSRADVGAYGGQSATW